MLGLPDLIVMIMNPLLGSAGDDFDYWIPLSFDDAGNVRQFEVRFCHNLLHHCHHFYRHYSY